MSVTLTCVGSGDFQQEVFETLNPKLETLLKETGSVSGKAKPS